MCNAILPRIIADIDRASHERGQLARDLQQFRHQLEVVLQSPVAWLPVDQNDRCNSLEAAFHADARAPQPGDAPVGALPVYKCTVRLSWVDPYVTTTWVKSEGEKSWRSISQGELPRGLEGVGLALDRYLENIGYVVLKGSLLQELVPGHFSDLDDAPANVYQVLFSEWG